MEHRQWQRQRREQRVHEHNKAVPDIIPLNQKNDSLPPVGVPISDDEMSDDDSSIGSYSESEGDFLDNEPRDAGNTTNQPAPEPPPNRAPEGATPPNHAPEGANPPPRCSRRNQPSNVWKRDENDRLRRLKLNRDLYALTCSRHDVPPMAQNLSKKNISSLNISNSFLFFISKKEFFT